MGYKVENWVKGGKHQEVRDYDDAMKTHLEGNGWVKVASRDDWTPDTKKKNTAKKSTKKSK